MKKQEQEKKSYQKSIELAILNGIEAFNRSKSQDSTAKKEETSPKKEQSEEIARKQPIVPEKNEQNEKKSKGKTQKKDKSQKSLGETNSQEAMTEAGYKPRKKSKAKGTGTPVKLGTGSILDGLAPVKEKKTQKPENKAHAPREKGNEIAPEVHAETLEKAEKAHKKHEKNKKPVKILFFGGVGEIGKNMTAIEYGNDIIVIDAGIIFPTEEMPGIDLVFPDITYLVQNKNKIRGVFLTHGHEDHIGGVPYLMKEIEPTTPIYGTKLTLALVDNKLREHRLNNLIERTVKPKDTVKAGVFEITFINVNHSIAGALAFAIKTPYGVIYHSGDYKIDLTPVAGAPIDLSEIAEIGKQGVLLYMGESTNVERPGYTMSEKVVGTTLEHLFAEHADRRLIIATFASNVHRLQQIIDISVKYRRKVALSGRSMLNVVEAATKIGELTIPEGVLIDVDKAKNYFDREIVIVSTGSQGEPMSALTRMAQGEYNKVTIGENDTIIISASPIPGNERMIYRTINNLYEKGAKVVYESLEKIHVSGHACQEEHKIMHTLLHPKFFIPVHGEYRHLKRHALLAEETGIPDTNIVIPKIGACVELTSDTIRFGESFPSGSRMIDGDGFEDATSFVLKDRLTMSAEGVFVVEVAISDGVVLGDPIVESKGFVSSDTHDFGKELRDVVSKTMDTLSVRSTTEEIASAIKRSVRSYLYKKTKQSPMVIPIVREV